MPKKLHFLAIFAQNWDLKKNFTCGLHKNAQKSKMSFKQVPNTFEECLYGVWGHVDVQHQ